MDTIRDAFSCLCSSILYLIKRTKNKWRKTNYEQALCTVSSMHSPPATCFQWCQDLYWEYEKASTCL